MTEEPPLRLDLRSFDRAASTPLCGRWIVALALLATVSSFFLLEALYALVDRHVSFAVAPALFQWDRVARAEVESLRGDRLTPNATRPGRADDRVRVEQLRSSGLGMRPFTHVVAFLAHVPEAAPSQPQPQTAISLTDEAALPPEILNGGSRLALGEDVSAYAAAPSVRAASREPPPLGEPINVTRAAESPPGQKALVQRVIVAKPGDSFAMIMRALGAPSDQAQSIQTLYASQGAAFTGGEKISVLEPGERDAALAAPLEVRVDREGASPWEAALADDGRYAIRAAPESDTSDAPALADPQSTVDDLRQSADESVRDSFYGLIESQGVDRSLIDEAVRLCAHDFDLEAPVAAADRVELLYTPGDADQRQLRFVKLTANGKTHEYYRFTAPDDGSVDYYDRGGRSVTKFLLRKPAPAGRLGDGFGWRVHPILKDRRFHEGDDYDAPAGSPVEAAGAGVVTKISEESGYGKYIRVRHDLGYETTYAHVAGFARGVTVGSRVRQGQVIAYVGSTGLSTGPHLYYEVRINGRNVDPLKIRLADGRVLSGLTLAAFESRREQTDKLIKASPIAHDTLAGASASK